MAKAKRPKFSVVTNLMPDDVYEHLDHKAKNGELASYIIRLVQMDLAAEYNRLNFEQINETLRELSEQIKKIERIEVREDKQEKQELESVVHFNATDKPIGEIDEDEMNFNF
ncbi:hypothetical protein [Thermaerobacillus caldiproteolyticus]|uniref:hypothetical protein n=1 Tax=Thermaerobacillus caldiproteolyticus TaxID=247480 RepID=UPI00188B5D42|nr:hypothetical protein [Anoxybacillus caldiproteolyticus]QPA33391.1 hypothetical protein ISX45_19270 [Anoxybacillus caldiproteolyticus]